MPFPARPRIVADIGGTNGRFAIERGGALTERREYRNAEFSNLAALLTRYLADASSAGEDVQEACLAVAASVSEEGDARFTNASWTVSARDIAAAMKLGRVAVINDFAAQAYGLDTLGGDEAVQIGGPRSRHHDSAPHGHRAARVVLGPGTGLGCAALVPARANGVEAVAVTSEAGHMGFAAETEDDRRIHDAAKAKYGHVSWERVCCGAGLALIHATLASDDALPGVDEGDPTEVSNAARLDAASRAAASVRQFSGMLGAFAGDLALAFNAAGGVYLTGGVVAHLGAAFDAQEFARRFVVKGRYAEWLAGIAIFRISADDCALRGCARYLERVPAR